LLKSVSSGFLGRKASTNPKILIIKKVILLKEKNKALVLNKKLSILKQLNDEDNIFLDFSSSANGGFFSKKEYKFKVYYRYESKESGGCKGLI
jgi:hypothetical protein